MRIAIGWLLVGLLSCLGCGPSGKPASTTVVPTKSARQQDEAIQKSLQNALAALQPDRFGVSSDAVRSISSLNDWAERVRKRAEDEGHR